MIEFVLDDRSNLRELMIDISEFAFQKFNSGRPAPMSRENYSQMSSVFFLLFRNGLVDEEFCTFLTFLRNQLSTYIIADRADKGTGREKVLGNSYKISRIFW